MSYDRFKHEDAITDAWGICEDLKTISVATEQGELSKKDIVLMLNGLTRLQDIKFNIIFKHFENSLKSE